MTESKPSFLKRLVLAWRVLTDAKFAANVAHMSGIEAPAPGGPRPVESKPAPAMLEEIPPESALQMLGLLQQEGRLVDFLQEDVSSFSDADIGGAARVVHEGCRKALHQYFTIKAVRDEQEGARITLQKGFDASAIRLTGNVMGQAPFTGTLAHRGWRALEVKLPKIAKDHDVNVLAPAELEL
ncbi:MAG: DUF2760 domain-containing protein [Pseudomonadota bacterium]